MLPAGFGAAGLLGWAFVARTLYLRKRRESERLREQMFEQEHRVAEAFEKEVAVRRQSEEACASQALYHSLVMNIPQYEIRKDCSGRYTFANSRAAQLLGREVADIVGRTDSEILPEPVAQDMQGRMATATVALSAFTNGEENGRMRVATAIITKAGASPGPGAPTRSHLTRSTKTATRFASPTVHSLPSVWAWR